VILTVRTSGTPDQTAFFDPDPEINATEAEELAGKVENLLGGGDVAALTLSGSSPSTTTHGLYSDLIALARARKIPVFLDSYGPALASIWGFWPDVIQLNRREAATYLGKPSAGDADTLALLDRWARHGVSCGVVTDGPGPAFISWKGTRFEARPPRIDAINPIGSGDSLLAGLVHGWLKNMEPPALIRHALACAVANALVWDAGAIDPEEVARQTGAVEVVPITG
jgi:fructose-1-phosphate kinase PfkB-like protein